MTDIIEMTEGLAKSDSPMHALSTLGQSHSAARRGNGKMESENNEKSGSGTYAKQC